MQHRHFSLRHISREEWVDWFLAQGVPQPALNQRGGEGSTFSQSQVHHTICLLLPTFTPHPSVPACLQVHHNLPLVTSATPSSTSLLLRHLTTASRPLLNTYGHRRQAANHRSTTGASQQPPASAGVHPGSAALATTTSATATTTVLTTSSTTAAAGDAGNDVANAAADAEGSARLRGAVHRAWPGLLGCLVAGVSRMDAIELVVFLEAIDLGARLGVKLDGAGAGGGGWRRDGKSEGRGGGRGDHRDGKAGTLEDVAGDGARGSHEVEKGLGGGRDRWLDVAEQRCLAVCGRAPAGELARMCRVLRRLHRGRVAEAVVEVAAGLQQVTRAPPGS